MGYFDDLPKDVVWLILREALTIVYGEIRVYDPQQPKRLWFSIYHNDFPQFTVTGRPYSMTEYVIPLSLVCKRFRSVLKWKSRWDNNNPPFRWGFV